MSNNNTKNQYATQFERQKFAPKAKSVKGTWIECETCNEHFYVTPARIRQVQKKGHQIRFCSMQCRDYAGDKNPFWGRKHNDKSIEKMANHPNRPIFEPGENNPNYTRFGEDFIGITKTWWKSKLLEEVGKCEHCGYCEEVGILELHHADRDTSNNTRENVLLLCPNCHRLDHFIAQDGAYSRNKYQTSSDDD